LANEDYEILKRAQAVLEALADPKIPEVVLGLDGDYESGKPPRAIKAWIVYLGTDEADVGTETHDGDRMGTVNFDLVIRTRHRTQVSGPQVEDLIDAKNKILNALYADPSLNGHSDGTRQFTSGNHRVNPQVKDGIQEQVISCQAQYLISDVTAR